MVYAVSIAIFLYFCRLSNIHMDIATKDGTGAPANTVEKCHCPPSYRGTSCEVRITKELCKVYINFFLLLTWSFFRKFWEILKKYDIKWHNICLQVSSVN